MVYLLHFKEPFRHARHYLGSTGLTVEQRLEHHRANRGARLTQVVNDAGIDYVVSRTWQGGRELERKLKRMHGGNKLCPICKQQAKQIKLEL
jgi:predicted GIY-YIG superfamily endonuclease